ncbi:hypothetical protein LTR28_000970 [Elasticomyces elasticus]|nr:hypothetical protein LTR28_000970 [Elasticomyces elasticus]
MLPTADAIADCVLRTFDALPAKHKPRPRENGEREWVPLAGIVISKALATGMKCLPVDKVAKASGNVLHDWHAEVLAIRAFNRFLVDECADLAAKGMSGISDFLKWRGAHETEHLALQSAVKKQQTTSTVTERGRSPTSGTDEHEGRRTTDALSNLAYMDGQQPFEVRDDVKIYMYISEAPCGDASMELTMAAQEDATPWPIPVTEPPHESSDNHLTFHDTFLVHPPSAPKMLGRGHFDRLGIVRRKPARPDAPPTLSKSCSDKLALKQCTSLLSSLVSLLVHPGNAYLSTLVLPESQYVQSACERAFGAQGRLAPLTDPEVSSRWTGTGYAFVPFTVLPTSREFRYSRRSTAAGEELVPSNLSSLCTPWRQEMLINGVLQGRKQFDPKGASTVCRRSMWRLVAQVVVATAVATGSRRTEPLDRILEKRTYRQVKDANDLEGRKRVKVAVQDVLGGWVRNDGDENWSRDGSNLK